MRTSFAVSWVAAVLLIGCGESDREAYVSRADAICRDFTADYKAAVERPEGYPLDRLHADSEAFMRQLRDVSPPRSLQDRVDAYLAVNQSKIERISEAAGEDSSQARDRILDDPEIVELDRRSKALARQIGFRSCS